MIYYEGNWVENFRHDIGKIVYKDKGTYYGEWSKGKAQLSNKCATEYSYWFFNYKIIISIFLNFSDNFIIQDKKQNPWFRLKHSQYYYWVNEFLFHETVHWSKNYNRQVNSPQKAET